MRRIAIISEDAGAGDEKRATSSFGLWGLCHRTQPYGVYQRTGSWRPAKRSAAPERQAIVGWGADLQQRRSQTVFSGANGDGHALPLPD